MNPQSPKSRPRPTKTLHPVRPEREALPPASHFATCPRGLEALLEAELTAAGGQVVRQVPAGVLFMADAAAEMRVNLT
ncbi:MAG: class I SAM-dependent RNA methyltransferase, partial [Gammaproteobacteria bacterium]|nr:class I SAM-dependent RNA methyltransferase [Gammaproteobacteria bacterium]